MTSYYRHGISLGIERFGSEFFMSFRLLGKLSHQDYQTITPMLDAALNGVEQASINAFVDCSHFEGWELRAAWDDFKLGLKHGKEFHKIAIYSNQGSHEKWLEYGAKVAAWFISGNVEFFDSEEKALNWLQGSY